MKHSVASKIIRKITLKPLSFQKASSSPSIIEQVQFYRAAYECISRDPKVLWIA